MDKQIQERITILKLKLIKGTITKEEKEELSLLTDTSGYLLKNLMEKLDTLNENLIKFNENISS